MRRSGGRSGIQAEAEPQEIGIHARRLTHTREPLRPLQNLTDFPDRLPAPGETPMAELWSAYARAYAEVMSQTTIHRDLISYALGDQGPLPSVPDGTTVLDCGAGPGLLVSVLAQSRPHSSIFAIENNPAMVDLFLARCRTYMEADAGRSSVALFKLDLNQFTPESLDRGAGFNFVFLVNVLYAVRSPVRLLSTLRRTLLPGGEIRLIGPRKDSDTEVILNAIERDLKARNLYDRLRADFECVRKINMERLSPMARRWTTQEVVNSFLKAGFLAVIHVSEEPYCGQAMCVVART